MQLYECNESLELYEENAVSIAIHPTPIEGGFLAHGVLKKQFFLTIFQITDSKHYYALY